MLFLILLLICQFDFFDLGCASMRAPRNIATLLDRRSQKVCSDAYKKKMSAVIEKRLSRVLASHEEGSLEEGQERLTEEDIATLKKAVNDKGVLDLRKASKEFFLRVFCIDPEIPLSTKRIVLNYEDLGIFLRFFQNLIGINFFLYDERREVQPEELIYLSTIQELRFSSLFMHPCRKIPAWVNDLKRLRILDLSDNLNIDIDDDFEFPPNLEELTLQCCKLRKTPRSLCRLERLRSLDLHGNINIDNDFALPPNLEKLVLSYCQLRKIPNSLSTHPCLTHIDFSMNGEIDMSDSFEFPSNLEVLNLSGCRLERIPEWMHTLKDPRALDLFARSNLLVDAERGRTAGALWGI